MIALPVGIKGDVSDYLESGKTIETLLNIYNNTPEYIPAGAVTRDEYLFLKGHLIYLQSKVEELLKSKKKKDKL